MSELKVIAFENCKELGEKVDQHLKRMTKKKRSYLVNVEASRFNNGEGTLDISESMRDNALYALAFLIDSILLTPVR